MSTPSTVARPGFLLLLAAILHWRALHERTVLRTVRRYGHA
jgi:hypothetical protein